MANRFSFVSTVQWLVHNDKFYSYNIHSSYAVIIAFLVLGNIAAGVTGFAFKDTFVSSSFLIRTKVTVLKFEGNSLLYS